MRYRVFLQFFAIVILVIAIYAKKQIIGQNRLVRLDKIYTRGGDKGETSLGDGQRVKKNSLRVDVYGEVDEANAAIGVAIIYC